MSTTTAGKSGLDRAQYFRAVTEFELAPAELKEILAAAPDEVVVVDVRDADSYGDGHIPGSRSVPRDALVGAYASLPKDKLIVAYSADLACPLAARAALELAQKGYRVQRLIGGLTEWARKGYPVQASSQAW